MDKLPLNGVKIGWDLDGVFYDFVQGFIDFLSTRGYKDLPYAESWNFYETQWGWSHEKFASEYALAVKSGLFSPDIRYEIGNVSKALDATSRLGAKNIIVTARSLSGVETHAFVNTVKWVNHHNLKLDRLVINRDKTIVKTDFFIEDNCDNYEAIRASGSRCYLFDQPWNRCTKDVERVFTHEEFIEKIISEVKNGKQGDCP